MPSYVAPDFSNAPYYPRYSSYRDSYYKDSYYRDPSYLRFTYDRNGFGWYSISFPQLGAGYGWR